MRSEWDTDNTNTTAGSLGDVDDAPNSRTLMLSSLLNSAWATAAVACTPCSHAPV